MKKIYSLVFSCLYNKLNRETTQQPMMDYQIIKRFILESNTTLNNSLCCCYSVTKSCLALCNPMDCSTSDSSVLQYSQSLLRFIDLVMLNHLIFCCPLLLLPSIFPSIRIYSNELTLRIRWLHHQSF